MKEYNINNINVLLENTPSTPRISVAIFSKIQNKEKLFGINSLLARLLLQGTKKYNAIELAKKFEEECIDISTKAKQDYIKISLTFLNEDFSLALELTKDILQNSTFDTIEKEKYKIKGEIISELDNPRIKLSDLFLKTIFKNHPYASTLTSMLEDIDKITKEDIISAHENMLNSTTVISIAGDFSNVGKNEQELLDFIKEEFSFIKPEIKQDEIEDIFENKNNNTLFIEKNDMAQAQIIQGWLLPSLNSDLCPKYAVLNNILGASGLSSRLFVNLRDKQGLAYTVRSQYETLLHSGVFTLYIGCDPNNIEKSLFGFEDELQKLADKEPDELELKGAKENISGRIKYFSQNNSQIASQKGFDYIMGLGLDWEKKYLDKIYKVTSEDVSLMARDILSKPSLKTIIAPSKYNTKNYLTR